MPPYAHSQNPRGVWHKLEDHLLGVAERARAFAEKFDAGELGYWAGLWHDVGKASPAFQAYLQAPHRSRGTDHKGAGSSIAARYLEGLAFLIAGHHGGLPNKNELKAWLKEKGSSLDASKSLELCRGILPRLEPVHSLSDFLPPHILEKPLPHHVELFLRMLFSCLVDADFLNTEEHFTPQHSQIREVSYTLPGLWEQVCTSQDALSGKQDDAVSRVRHEVYLSCVQAAENPMGVFRLTVPTGGGKTRSAMAFALRHALRHGLDRVIVAIPYTTIIEQTAQVYREIFGDQAVLEHHSAIAIHEEEEEGADGTSWARLAAENWDAPIVVTTTVQLFESLFGNSPSQCRKLHNLARSIIVLDEAQFLPTTLLTPILDVLRSLVRHYKVTLVLCTATQPALEISPYLKGFEHIEEIAPEPERLFKELRRVRYEVHSGESWDWQRAAQEMRSSPQALAVVNTRRDALSLLEHLGDPDALLLSTLLCGAHRRAVIQEVKARLQENKSCRLVSTQVVEAGVDLDFPLVLRAVGPLDRIVQAAGRCNREGKLSQGRVIVFEPSEGGLPGGAYRTGTDEARILLQMAQDKSLDLDDPSTYSAYFRRLYQAIDLDSKRIQELRRNFDFPEVARRFRMIESGEVPVVVRYEDPEKGTEEVDELLGKLHHIKETSPRWLWRRLQPYTVNLPRWLFERHASNQLIREIAPGIHVWAGRYDLIRGLAEGPLDPGTLIF